MKYDGAFYCRWYWCNSVLDLNASVNEHHILAIHATWLTLSRMMCIFIWSMTWDIWMNQQRLHKPYLSSSRFNATDTSMIVYWAWPHVSHVCSPSNFQSINQSISQLLNGTHSSLLCFPSLSHEAIIQWSYSNNSVNNGWLCHRSHDF